MLIWLLAVAVGCLLFAYVPLVLVVRHRDAVRSSRRRPVDQVLSEAYAEGRITRERFEALMDEVHRSMPTPESPYPLVREWDT